MNNRLFISIITVVFLTVNSFSQQKLNLQDVIILAQSQSLSSKKVTNAFENKYWRFNSYKKSFLPSVTFNGTLPNLNIGISEITLQDGTSKFVRTSQVNYSASLLVNQPIKWTGGNVFVSSDLSRLDLLGSNSNTSYNASPFYIGYQQPIYKFNAFKWQSKIEPLAYEEAKKQSVEQKEEVSMEAVRLFFEVINKKSNFEVAKLNLTNSDTLYKISQGRYNLGKIAENELLQIELTKLNAEKNLAQSELDVLISLQNLKTYLSIPPSENIELLVETSVPKFQVNIEKAVEMANKNRSEIVSFKKSLLESERELDRVKKDNSFSADLFFSYGVTQTSPDIPGSYINPLDKESVNVGISIPVYNWGLSKARIKQQKANSELINIQITQNKNNFERDVFIQATQFNLMKKQVEISQKSMVVAKKRYIVSKQRFLIGKSDILTFNTALNERNQAINSYYQTLRQYWIFYYRIRKLTHFDFENNKELKNE